jgi:two-component system, OmpR family, response regulator
LADKFDLLIVDRMLPDLDGLTLVQTLRVIRIDTPVLFITTMSAINDRVAGPNAGGDNYLVKPFTFSELAARVQALPGNCPALGGRRVSKSPISSSIFRNAW